MPRLRRYLPPLLILLLLIFICGKLLLTPVTTVGMLSTPNRGLVRAEVEERGWPWLFLQSSTDFQPNHSKRLFREWRGDFAGFSFWKLMADLAVLSAVVAVFGLLLWWQQRRTGSWLRFSLFQLMVLVAIVAAGCGWWTNHANQHRREQEIVKYWGGHETYRFFHADHRPTWLRRFISDDQLAEVFNHVDSVNMTLGPPGQGNGSEPPPEFAKKLSGLAYLSGLEISVSPAWHLYSFAPPPLRLRSSDMQTLDQLDFVVLDCGAADGETLKALANLPRLESLRIMHCEISDADLAELAGFQRLKTLVLFSCKQLTDQSFDTILQMRALRRLDLIGCQKLTEAGVVRLAESRSLRELRIYRMEVVSKELRQLLKERLPNLQLTIEGPPGSENDASSKVKP